MKLDEIGIAMSKYLGSKFNATTKEREVPGTI